MPLRASNITFNDLRHIIVLGNMEFLKRLCFSCFIYVFIILNLREWPLLKNLPKMSVMEGSPMNRADLMALKIKVCRTCILLSAKVL